MTHRMHEMKKWAGLAAIWLLLAALVFAYTDPDEFAWTYEGEDVSQILVSAQQAALEEEAEARRYDAEREKAAAQGAAMDGVKAVGPDQMRSHAEQKQKHRRADQRLEIIRQARRAGIDAHRALCGRCGTHVGCLSCGALHRDRSGSRTSRRCVSARRHSTRSDRALVLRHRIPSLTLQWAQLSRAGESFVHQAFSP